MPPTPFARYGIQHDVSKRWAWARVAGDAYEVEGGPRFVTYADVSVGIAMLLSIGGWFTGHWGLAAFSAAFVYTMKTTDLWYNRITAGYDETDGVVQGASQVYPGAILNVEARDPTSHTGETRSQRSYDEIEDVLTGQLGVIEIPD